MGITSTPSSQRRRSTGSAGLPSTGSSTTCSAPSSATASMHFRSRRGLPMSENPMREAIKSAIDENPVILFMKGTPEQPACGFSARTVAVLQSLGQPFAAVDILPDPRIRQELSEVSNWPTIPQLFIEGDLVGGCDIVTEMYETGELHTALGLENAPVEAAPEPQAPEPAPMTIENRL